jgi:hypothetical protein
MMAITSPRKISTEAMRADLSDAALEEPAEQVGLWDPETVLRAITGATLLRD